jgi:predicted MFS family arabinose efflux permease
MPSFRALGLALLLGVLITVYFALWFGWPAFLALAIGATMGVVLLLFATSLADDPAEADAAWRDAAPDLAARERPARASRPDPSAGDDPGTP